MKKKTLLSGGFKFIWRGFEGGFFRANPELKGEFTFVWNFFVRELYFGGLLRLIE